MKEYSQNISFEPIGHVESEFTGDASSEEMRSRPSRIVVRPEMQPGLMGLAEGDYLLVLFCFHRATEYEIQLHPGHDPSRPLRGVFATRSQYRLNGIGATIARIVSISGTVVTVIGLDAQDGSPVLDIKPFRRQYDTVPGEEEQGLRSTGSSGTS